MSTFTLRIDGMHCGGCEKTVETRLSRVPGVRSVEADHEAGTVDVRFVAGKEPEGSASDDGAPATEEAAVDELREAVAGLPYELQGLDRS